MKRWDKPDSDIIGDIEKAIDRLPRMKYRYDPRLKELLAKYPLTKLIWDEKLEAYVRKEIEEDGQ